MEILQGTLGISTIDVRTNLLFEALILEDDVFSDRRHSRSSSCANSISVVLFALLR